MIGNLLRQYVDTEPIGPTLPPSGDSALEARLDTLELACAGLWELLKSKHGYTDAELAKVIEEVDLRDGKKDGKVSMRQELCPSCGRRLLTRQRHHCAWCGVELAQRPF